MKRYFVVLLTIVALLIPSGAFAGTKPTGGTTSGGKTTIRGVVVSEETSAPLAGVSVAIEIMTRTTAYKPVVTLTTDASGRYSFVGAQGPYRITYGKVGFMSETVRIITAVAGQVYEPVVCLDPLSWYCTVRGTVRDASTGLPVAGALVQFNDYEQRIPSTQVYTDSSGHYIAMFRPFFCAINASGGPGLWTTILNFSPVAGQEYVMDLDLVRY